MLVVSDASPINILIRIGQVDVLARLFDAVVIPTSVADEMSRPATPQVVRDWIAQPPVWFSVRTPATPVSPAQLRHRGERDAIALAQEIKADAILLDEEKPRAQAAALGLAVVGTVGVLERAADRGLITDLNAVHTALQATDSTSARHCSPTRSPGTWPEKGNVTVAHQSTVPTRASNSSTVANARVPYCSAASAFAS